MYAVLNHHDPGTLTIPARLNDFTNSDALAAAYGVHLEALEEITSAPPTSSPAQGEACLKGCSLYEVPPPPRPTRRVARSPDFSG